MKALGEILAGLSRHWDQARECRLRLGSEHLRYVLYNPGFVRSSHQGDLSRPARAFVSLLARTLATPPERAIEPIVELIANPPREPLSMYARRKRLPLTIDDADRAEADRLYTETRRLLTAIRATSP